MALQGKNLVFLPPPAGGTGEGEGEGEADGELLLVHWFRPLRIYRVSLGAARGRGGGEGGEDDEGEFVGLELLHSQDVPRERELVGSEPSGLGPSSRDAGWNVEVDSERHDAEFRGGTPGMAAGPGAWWGLLHRTCRRRTLGLPAARLQETLGAVRSRRRALFGRYHSGGSLRHDPWAWCIRRRGGEDGGGEGAFEVGMSPVGVVGRDPTSLIFDPCSIVPERALAEGRAGEAETGLLVTTAESPRGWFEPQPFRSRVYRLLVKS